MALEPKTEPNEGAAGLAEDLGELRNQLGRCITELEYLAAGNAAQFYAHYGKQITLEATAAKAVALGQQIVHYAQLYTED